jgi:hypothetical protein
MDDKSKFLDDEEEAILEGRVPTTEKDLQEIAEEHLDDDDTNEYDEDDQEEEEIDVDSFDERSRRAKQEEIENNRKLVERLNVLEEQVNQNNEEKIAKEYEISQQRRLIYQQQAERIEAEYKKVQDDIETVKAIKRDAELKEEKTRIFQAEDTLEKLNEARFNLDLKMREFAKQAPQDYSSDEEYVTDNRPTPRKQSSKFDLNKLDPDSRNFVKTNPYMNPSSEHYDQGLVDETIAVMEDLKKKYVFSGKKAKVYSAGFYREVEDAMHNKYSTRDERMRNLVNNPITGVKRNGDFMKDGRNKSLGLLNNMARQLIKKVEVNDKNGKPLNPELKAKLYKKYNDKHQENKAHERGYYS